MAQRARRHQLVVRGEQRSRRVQNREPATAELDEGRQPAFYSVERVSHVEPRQRGVAGLEQLERLVWRQEQCIVLAPAA
ncbi:MAG: hypothetical protein M3R70_13275 [Actinomycetota bacterium]|nr:hypothetical protein [Actinomycetota bacterium]